jgi:hypothetical protein
MKKSERLLLLAALAALILVQAGAACTANYDCIQGQVCVAGACTACTDNSQCDSGLCYLGGCTGTYCSSDSHCGMGQTCEGHTCMISCTHSCPGGLACIDHVCTACTKNDDCLNGEVCMAGTCTACSASTQCSLGKVCVAGACTACTEDSQCPDGVCYNGACSGGPCPCAIGMSCSGAGHTCLISCHHTSCPGGLVCGSDEYCRACISDTECSGGQFCIDGKCSTPTTTPEFPPLMVYGMIIGFAGCVLLIQSAREH